MHALPKARQVEVPWPKPSLVQRGREPRERGRLVVGWSRVDLIKELHTIARALNAAGVHDAVCGGIAVTIYGAPRA